VENFQLGYFLKREREKRQLSSRELAKLTRRSKSEKGVAASHINKIENGRVHPTFQTLQKIAAALELPLVIVLDGSKANPETVAIVSTSEVAQSLPQALRYQELVQLLLVCQKLTAEQIKAVLGSARAMHSPAQSDTDDQIP
jgi:transcriptional regulator with XRE-family HTH domain